MQERLAPRLSLADVARSYASDAVGMTLSGVVMPGGFHAGDQGRA